MGEPIVGPREMGQKLVEALGLDGIKGIVKLQINCEAGDVPTLTIVRTITQPQAAMVELLLQEWDCTLVPKGPIRERQIKGLASDEPESVPL